jgi:hypothetical protein
MKCGLIVINENKRIFVVNKDAVMAHAVGDGEYSRGTYNSNVFDIINFR